MKCANCGEVFHYCSSCSSERCCDNGFCSDKCMRESGECIDALDNTKHFLDTLSEEQISMFKKLMNNYCEFEYEIDNFIETHLD